MTIDENRAEDKVQLTVHGKVDINSAQEFQNSILKAFQKGKTVVVDMRDCQYITSGGLRALVIGQKTANAKGGKLVIINAGPEIRDVFRVTGFEKILTIQ